MGTWPNDRYSLITHPLGRQWHLHGLPCPLPFICRCTHVHTGAHTLKHRHIHKYTYTHEFSTSARNAQAKTDPKQDNERMNERTKYEHRKEKIV